MWSNHLILCRPLLLPSIFPSIRVFSSESVLCIRWPKFCSFSINLSNEYSELISFRMDWFDLLAVQGTLKSFLQHHSSKASILQHSAFFIVQLSHPYMTTGETIALTRRTFVVSLIREFKQLWSPFNSLTCVKNKASSPIQLLSAGGTTPIHALSCLAQIDHNNRNYLHKDFSGRLTQKPKLSSLVKNCHWQSKPVKSARATLLIICTETNARN